MGVNLHAVFYGLNWPLTEDKKTHQTYLIIAPFLSLSLKDSLTDVKTLMDFTLPYTRTVNHVQEVFLLQNCTVFCTVLIGLHAEDLQSAQRHQPA